MNQPASSRDLCEVFVHSWKHDLNFVVLPFLHNGMPATSVVTPHSLERSIEEFRACCLLALGATEDSVKTIDLAVNEIRQAKLSVPFGRIVKKKFTGAFLREQWAIGRVDRRYEDVLRNGVGDEITWLPLPTAQEFYADSFVANVGLQRILLYEHLAYDTNKGSIRARILSDELSNTEYTLLDQAFHMSYPFVFKAEGRLWCMPEASGSGSLKAYAIEMDPLRLVEPRLVMDNVDIVDPTLIEHDGMWWLFASRTSLGGNRCLCIWYATSPFGEWAEHAQNPVKIDVRSSRPAGLMQLVDGALYRPAQDCSVSYGGSITVNRIDVLTTREFQETPVRSIHPSSSWDRRYGLHTMCADGNATIVDVNRRMFSFAQFRSVLGI